MMWKKQMRGPRRAAGVTLIELMVTTAIVAILAAIAYPSYQRYTARTHRNAAQACLSQYAQFMERYYTTNLTYVGAVPDMGCRNESNMDRHYRFELADAQARSFRVTATPLGAQAAIDTECGTLGLDQSGARTPNNNTCW